MKHKEILLSIVIILFFYSKINAQTNTSPTQTVCQGSLLEPYLINPPTAGSSYSWSITGVGNNITPGSTSNSITIDWFNPGVYTLSVTETDVDGCVGLPVLLEVTVDPLPTQTIANDESACVGGVIPDLTAIGSNVTWYADASLNNVVSTTNILSTGQTGVGIYTYYVTESLNGCEGPEISVDLEIYNSPSAPSAQDETTCFGSLIPDLTAIGSNVTWYSDASLTTVLSNNNNLNTNQTNAGSYDYYVTVTDANSCESSATTVNLEIYNSPSAPSAQDETACFGSLVPDLTATGSNVTWYSDVSLTTVLSNNNNLNTNQTNAGSYDYYVTVTDANSCESSATSVNLEIYSAPITGPINHW